MNWEAVGAVGEVVGALAVVATLLCLAIQIRQSTNQARAAAQRDVNSAFQAPGAKIWYDQVRPFTGAEVKAHLEQRFNDKSTLPPAFVDSLPWHRPESTP